MRLRPRVANDNTLVPEVHDIEFRDIGGEQSGAGADLHAEEAQADGQEGCAG